MSATNENVSDVLIRATDEQRGVEVDGRPMSLNDRVAAEVMGWVWRRAEKNWLLPDEQVFMQSIDFIGDPGQDYLVLEHVRNTWSEEAKRKFGIAICDERSLDFGRRSKIGATADYRTGDWSLAALAVVTASPVPPCLAQQFPTPSAIDRQKRETNERCEAAASEENAGERMTGERFDVQQ